MIGMPRVKSAVPPRDSSSGVKAASVSGGRAQRAGELADATGHRGGTRRALVEPVLDVFHHDDGIVDQDAQRDDHPDHRNLMQYAPTQVIQPQADQRHKWQHRCHQHPHAPAHADQDHRDDDRHAAEQAPFEAVEPVLDLIGLEEHFIDLQRSEVRPQQLQPFAHLRAEADRIDLPALGDQFHQHRLFPIEPGAWLGRLHRAAPDIGNCRQRHAAAIRQRDLGRL